ncbi:hypothetical protein [Alteromonas oceanisediminis]|uniref:hypothetical protein n=1 Tax=Alteromonas oceanisediminis TaxID=2836180 RepID=UPI001BDABC2E|nr:hypothetical protein [Alteromonas oceanisediminis]MBT0585328.1 hypothetical protein [Alteromonas oceanisediminis]
MQASTRVVKNRRPNRHFDDYDVAPRDAYRSKRFKVRDEALDGDMGLDDIDQQIDEYFDELR